MTLRFLRNPAVFVPAVFVPAVFVLSAALLAGPTVIFAQNNNIAPSSTYGGTTVEDIVARVNDQIISRSDYDRAMAEVDSEARQHGRDHPAGDFGVAQGSAPQLD